MCMQTKKVFIKLPLETLDNIDFFLIIKDI